MILVNGEKLQQVCAVNVESDEDEDQHQRHCHNKATQTTHRANYSLFMTVVMSRNYSSLHTAFLRVSHSGVVASYIDLYHRTLSGTYSRPTLLLTYNGRYYFRGTLLIDTHTLCDSRMFTHKAFVQTFEYAY